MKVFITGVAGFIGSNLTGCLLKNGISVSGIDNFSYGNLRNIKPFLNHKNFNFINGNLTDARLIKNTKADVFVHLASQKIPRYSNGLRTLDENYCMTKNVITKCLKDKSKLVFASTSDVYGKNQHVPFSEESDLVLGNPQIKRWYYASSKIYGEQLIVAHHEEHGLNYSIARFFGAYGPKQNLTWWGGPQSVFIANALLRKPLEIHGNGLQTRTFTYIDDTISALMNLVTDKKANGETFNIAGNPADEITILDLAKKIWK